MIPPVDQPKGELSEARVREILAGCEGVTPGPWESDGVKNDGFTSYEVTDQHGKSIVDTYNAGVIEIHEEDGRAWDEQGRKNLMHIARLDPDTVRALCNLALNALATKQAETIEMDQPLTDRERIVAMSAGYPDAPCDMTWAEVEAALTAIPAAGVGESFQYRVAPWLGACFGPEISNDKLERGDRLLEEVLELLQSGDYPPERVAALTSYVFGRDKGEPYQEVGGVMVTLAAYCLAHGLDMHVAGETELARIWTKVDKIRAKQAARPTGSALPIPAAGVGELTEAEPFFTGRGWENLSCDDQYRLARQIASNVGYVLTPEPSIQAAEDTAATAAEIRVGVLREAADTARDVVRGCNEPWQRAGEAIYDALRALSEATANGK